MSVSGGASLGSGRGEGEIQIGKAIQNLDKLEGRLGSMDSTGSGALGGLDQAGKRVESLGDRADAFKQKYQSAGQGLVGFGLAVAGVFGGGLLMAGNFEQGMDGVAASLG